jgi:SNF2 domain-containing protein/helicase-like protein
MSFELWSHQKDMIAHAKSCYQAGLGGAWWLAGCSTGKTYASLQFMRDMDFKRILVITTAAAAEDVWPTTVLEHFSEYELRLVSGTPKQRAKALNGLPERFIAVVSYGLSWRDKLPQFEAIISDESHKLQAHNSRVSLNAAKMGAKFKLLMTGTAFDDKLTYVYGQMRFIDPVVLGKYESFYNRHVNYYVPPANPYVKIATGYKNHEQLAERIAPYLIRVDSEKVLDLPPQMDIVKHLKFEKSMAKAYKNFAKDYITKINGEVLTASNAGVLAMRLHQVTGSVGSPKLQATLDILDEIGRKPTVIFTRFSEEVALLEQKLADESYRVMKLVGGLHQHVEFQKGEGDVLIANMDAGAEGVDLTRARYVIYYSTGYKRSSYIQSRYRVRRANSPDKQNPITFYHLRVAGTIDDTIAEVIEGKGDEENLLLTELHKLWYNS